MLLHRFNGRDAAKADILAATRVFVDLHISTDMCEFPANGRRLAIVLSGTMPCVIGGTTYNIPVRLELWDKHPYYAPLCWVRPTRDMVVKPTPNVDAHGKVFMPYLAQWSYPTHTTHDLLQVSSCQSLVCTLFR